VQERIFVVEDQRDLAHVIDLNLRDLVREIRVFHRGEAMLEQLALAPPSLVLLDLTLPDLDGIDICRRLRRDGFARLPILMLTARSSTGDLVTGLQAGADDYLGKPFKIAELRARVLALLRRGRHTVDAAQEVLQRGALTLDPLARQATLAGAPVELTAREFDLLLHLARRPDRVYSRAQLLESVWGAAYEGYEHTVNSLINRLRAKIEADPACPRMLVTVWGVGYKFCSTPQALPS